MINLKKIISNIVELLFIITVIIEITYSSIANSITEPTIKTSIKDYLLTGFIYDKEGNKTEIFNTLIKLTNLDEETIEKLINNETANDIITDIVNSIYDYNLTGDNSVKYTENQIFNTVSNNIDQVLDEINYSISNKEKEEVLIYTKNHATDIINSIYSTNIGDYTK